MFSLAQIIRNAMLVTGGNRRLISRTSPLGFLLLANHLLVIAWKSTTLQFFSHPPMLSHATWRGISLLGSQVKVVTSLKGHVTFRYCEICNLV